VHAVCAGLAIVGCERRPQARLDLR
jgi:hypothetical protein